MEAKKDMPSFTCKACGLEYNKKNSLIQHQRRSGHQDRECLLPEHTRIRAKMLAMEVRIA
jgi:hypothetical protein